MRNIRGLLSLVFLAVFCIATAHTADEIDRGLSLRTSAEMGLYPSKAAIGTALIFTEPLYGEREGIMWETARLEIGIHNRLTSSYDDASIELFIEPVAVFDLRTRFGIRYAHEAAGRGFTPMGSYRESYRSVDKKESEENAGFFIALAPRLKGAIGPLRFSNIFSYHYFSFRNNTSSYFYEPSYDLILKNSAALMQNTSEILWEVPVDWAAEILAGIEYVNLYAPDNEYRTHKLSAVAELLLPIGNEKHSLNIRLLAGPFLENRYYDIDSGVYISPELSMGLTNRF